MIKTINVVINQGKQYIPEVDKVELSKTFRGRPVISNEKVNEKDFENLCPLSAISFNPFKIDLGKCNFCGECAIKHPEKIKFTNDYKIAANKRENLIVTEGVDKQIEIYPDLIRKEIRQFFRGSLKLRQVSAAGDNSCELELNACDNVNFDMSRFGIDFVASPRHADGIVITGPISENMAAPLKTCYDATPEPKIIILVGVDAISGGIFAGSSALDRSFIDNHFIDLFVPGNPPHPLTFINGVLNLIRC
jgi:Ni,Fe-hydrogenase III small subunit